MHRDSRDSRRGMRRREERQKENRSQRVFSFLPYLDALNVRVAVKERVSTAREKYRVVSEIRKMSLRICKSMHTPLYKRKEKIKGNN